MSPSSQMGKPPKPAMRTTKAVPMRAHEQPTVPLVTAAQMQSLDRRTIDEAKVPGISLMERAGKGVLQVLEQEFGPPSGMPVMIVCGKGNNGGDGLVVARLLKQRRAKVQVILLSKPEQLSKDARHMYRRLLQLKPVPAISCEPSEAFLQAAVAKAHLVVDAMLGTGLCSAVKEPYSTAINVINASHIPTVAVDLPSGIESDTGAVLGTAAKAQATVTFGCPKIGLYMGEAIDHAGRITVVDIGIPPEYVKALQSPFHLLTPESICHLLPQRNPNSHKGTFGHVGIIAGSRGKTGAAALAARATLRTGAGLVTVATPLSVQSSLDARLLEAMTMGMPETRSQTLSFSALKPLTDFANQRKAVALGPGIGTHSETGRLIRKLLTQLDGHCVIDADGLNFLAGNLSLLSKCKRVPILTPHPGEMARLAGQSSAAAVNRDRLGIALKFAAAHNVIVVLKGARTIVALSNGQAAICATGNAGMASAGMGDVLTGVIVSLLAQGLTPWDAARTGVCLHGLAGDLAAEKIGQAGLIASDVIESLPHALQEILSFRQVELVR